MNEEKWSSYYNNVEILTVEKTGKVTYRIEFKASEEEIKRVVEAAATKHVYDAITEGIVHNMLNGDEMPPPSEPYPPVKPWSPYTDLHDKINGWLND